MATNKANQVKICRRASGQFVFRSSRMLFQVCQMATAAKTGRTSSQYQAARWGLLSVSVNPPMAAIDRRMAMIKGSRHGAGIVSQRSSSRGVEIFATAAVPLALSGPGTGEVVMADLVTPARAGSASWPPVAGPAWPHGALRTLE